MSDMLNEALFIDKLCRTESYLKAKRNICDHFGPPLILPILTLGFYCSQTKESFELFLDKKQQILKMMDGRELDNQLKNCSKLQFFYITEQHGRCLHSVTNPNNKI